MNKGQTVIVVKGAGIGSKIFTTLIVLFVISLIVGIIGFGAYFAAPQAVGPILKKMGIPVEIPPVAKETPAPAASAQEEPGAANFTGITLTTTISKACVLPASNFSSLRTAKGCTAWHPSNLILV